MASSAPEVGEGVGLTASRALAASSIWFVDRCKHSAELRERAQDSKAFSAIFCLGGLGFLGLRQLITCQAEGIVRERSSEQPRTRENNATSSIKSELKSGEGEASIDVLKEHGEIEEDKSTHILKDVKSKGWVFTSSRCAALEFAPRLVPSSAFSSRCFRALWQESTVIALLLYGFLSQGAAPSSRAIAGRNS